MRISLSTLAILRNIEPSEDAMRAWVNYHILESKLYPFDKLEVVCHYSNGRFKTTYQTKP